MPSGIILSGIVYAECAIAPNAVVQNVLTLDVVMTIFLR